MKQYFTNLGLRIDALTLRERVMLFAGVASSIVFVVYFFLLSPMFARQALLLAEISQNQNNISGINTEIVQRLQEAAADPDAASRARLAAIHADAEKLGSGLRAMQKGLVAPNRVVPLLETLLQAHGRLRLESLKKLPVSGVSEGAFELPKEVKAAPAESETQKVMNNIQKAANGGEAKAAPDAKAADSKAPPKAPELLFRHGVEITLQGSYLDMLAYMTALENNPTQLFWGRAKFDVLEYPQGRLTLTLYTLSLDPKWMKL